MLDNFGLGEFFMLALLALLFFGPERLPEMGAKLGQWIAKLTSYSRSFMTEWREEALAIQEAVSEVRAIRDEMMAAQQEISGSLQTARDDVAGSIELAAEAVTDARSQIQQNMLNQRRSAIRDLDAMAREEAAQKERDQSESQAIDKTQQILANLHQKKEAPATEPTSESGAIEETTDTASKAEPDSTEAAPGTDSLPPEDEWERNRREIQELVSRSKTPPHSFYRGPKAAGVVGSADSTPQAEPAAAPSQEPVLEAPGQAAAPEEPVEKEPRETAFDRTQRILDNLSRRRSGEPLVEEGQAAGAVQPALGTPSTTPVQATVSGGETRETRETAFDRTQQILDNLKKRKSTTPAEPVMERASVPAADRQALEQLQAQVASLHDELAALRREMEAIRSARSAADELAIEEAV